MAAEVIGRCKCPLCGSDKARLSLAKSLLPVLTCNGCNFQGFARSERSDEKLRALLLPAQDLAPEPAPAPAKPDHTPAPAIAAAPEPGAAQAAGGWGFMRG